MKWFSFFVAVLIATACASAQAKSPLGDAAVSSAEYVESEAPVVQSVGWHHHGAGASCGCGAESFGCCDHVTSWKDGLWNGYCQPDACGCGHGGHRHAFQFRHGRCSPCAAPAPSCDTCNTCNSAPACSTCNTGCGSRHGWGGCGCGNGCYRPHCGKIRCWANDWCGGLTDGYSNGGNSCGTPIEQAVPMEGPMPIEAAPLAPPPMPEAEKAARRPLNTLTPTRVRPVGYRYGIK